MTINFRVNVRGNEHSLAIPLYVSLVRYFFVLKSIEIV